MPLSVSEARGPGPALCRLHIGTECEQDAHRAIGREAEGGRRPELGNDSQRRPGNRPTLSTGSLVPARGCRPRAEHQCWPGIASLCRDGGGVEGRNLGDCWLRDRAPLVASAATTSSDTQAIKDWVWHLWDCCPHHGRPCVCASQTHGPLTVPPPRAAVRAPMCATPGRAA